MLHGAHAAGVHAVARKVLLHPLPKRIVAHTAGHMNASAQLSACGGLVGALAAGIDKKTASCQRFACFRKIGALDHQIHIQTAKHIR